MKKNQLEKHFATNYVNWKHVSNTTGDNQVIYYIISQMLRFINLQKKHMKNWMNLRKRKTSIKFDT